MSGELEPSGAVVSGEVVASGSAAGGLVPRTYRTQAQIDATIAMPEVVMQMIKGRLAENSWATYKVAWANYLRWCADTNRTSLPATLETVLSYLAHLATVEVAEDGTRGVSASTMRVWLAAAKRFHSYGTPPPEWPGGHLSVSDFVVGYEKKLARDPERAPKQATGARKVVMRALLDALPSEGARAVRDRAILLLGYWMAARRSELANLTTRSWRYTQDGLEMYLAYSKTDQAGEGAWVAIPEKPQYCPVAALNGWVELREANGLYEGPLFVPVDKHGNLRASRVPLSGSAFETVMTRAVRDAYEAAKAANDPKLKALLNPERNRWSPHSVRRGFATDARASLWDLLDISRHGRWSPQSKVVHIYIEEADRWMRHDLKPMQL